MHALQVVGGLVEARRFNGYQGSRGLLLIFVVERPQIGELLDPHAFRAGGIFRLLFLLLLASPLIQVFEVDVAAATEVFRHLLDDRVHLVVRVLAGASEVEVNL